MQRTYNSQDDRIGPFGQGWMRAYDIRTDEENPDTNQTDDSLNYMDRSDFFGSCKTLKMTVRADIETELVEEPKKS